MLLYCDVSKVLSSTAIWSPISDEKGKAFRRRREALGLSQEGFADQIGMHRDYYSATSPRLEHTKGAHMKSGIPMRL